MELRGVARLGGVHAIAEGPGELGEYAQFFRVRAFMNALDGVIVTVLHVRCDRLIGRQHKFLDHFFCVAARAEGDLDRLAALIGADLGLG